MLGTIKPDGTPRLVPVTFATTGDHVIIAVDHKPKATRRLARFDDIAADPRVTLLAQEYSDDWSQLWWVRADGIADLRPDPTEAELALLSSKYRQYQATPPGGPVIDVAVERWTDWSWS